MDDLQLLRDMDVRWSSTLLMVDRALVLREVFSFYVHSALALTNCW